MRTSRHLPKGLDVMKIVINVFWPIYLFVVFFLFCLFCSLSHVQTCGHIFLRVTFFLAPPLTNLPVEL